jgi:hypothetical protein
MVGHEESMRILAWQGRLDALRARARALDHAGARPAQLPLDAARDGFDQLRAAARPLFEAAAAAYGDVCPAGYPSVEDNGIAGPGASLGVRFSPWHAYFVGFENARRPAKAEPKPAGLAGALDIRVRRMPGDPLPPRDPNDRFELTALGMRWDEDRGWVETRRVLPSPWTPDMLAELFEAYLAGFNYDVAAGLPAGPTAGPR